MSVSAAAEPPTALKTGPSAAPPAAASASPIPYRTTRCRLRSRSPTQPKERIGQRSTRPTVAFVELRGQNCRSIVEYRSFVVHPRLLMAKSKKSNRFDGCSFTLVVGVIMTALFVINGVLVRAFLAPSSSMIDDRIYQPIQFGLPILMIFFEYWIFDRFMRRFSNDKTSR